MLALRLPKKLLFVVVLEGLAVNMKSLITLIFLLHAGFIYADNDKKLFEGINDVVRLNFSDGSYYIGQVGECLINLKKSTCMNGVGIYSTYLLIINPMVTVYFPLQMVRSMKASLKKVSSMVKVL